MGGGRECLLSLDGSLGERSSVRVTVPGPETGSEIVLEVSVSIWTPIKGSSAGQTQAQVLDASLFSCGSLKTFLHICFFIGKVDLMGRGPPSLGWWRVKSSYWYGAWLIVSAQ